MQKDAARCSGLQALGECFTATDLQGSLKRQRDEVGGSEWRIPVRGFRVDVGSWWLLLVLV